MKAVITESSESCHVYDETTLKLLGNGNFNTIKQNIIDNISNIIISI